MKKFYLLLTPLIIYLRYIIEGIESYNLSKGIYKKFEFVHLGEMFFNIIILIILLCLLIRKINIKTKYDSLMTMIFVVYICILYHLTSYIYIDQFMQPIVSLPHITESMLNTIPFKTISHMFFAKVTVIQVVGNILLLSPLAFFLRYFNWILSSKKIVLYIFLICIGIECFQFIQSYVYTMYDPSGSRHKADIDDLILNTTSGFIGVSIFKLYEKIRCKLDKIISNVKDVKKLRL